MKSNIQIASTGFKLSSEFNKKEIHALLSFLSKNFNLADTSLTLRVVDEAESQDLNKQYRHKDKPTNVLSFPNSAHFTLPPDAEIQTEYLNHLGDVVMCHPVIEREALEQHKSLRDHYTHLLIHGVLHLLGYDHENETDAIEMEQLEINLLETLHIANPYRALDHG